MWCFPNNVKYLTLNKPSGNSNSLFNVSVIIFEFTVFALLSYQRNSSVFITSLLSFLITPIVITTWLNCYKTFWWIYYTGTKDTVFVWFHFLVCMNYFQLLFVLVILEVWSIVCLELLLWLLLLLLLFLYHTLVLVWVVNQRFLLFHHLLVFYYLILLQRSILIFTIFKT